MRKIITEKILNCLGSYPKLPLLAVILGMMTVSSCEYKDIDEHDFSSSVPVRLHFNWEAVDSVPQRTIVVLYPTQDGKLTRGYMWFDVLNRDTVVQIPTGTYNVTAWNSDHTHVYIPRYAPQKSVYATTLDIATNNMYALPNILDSIYDGQKVLDYPDYMTHANKTLFEITKSSTLQELDLDMDSMVVAVDIQLKGIKGLELCKRVKGTINNCASKRFIAHDNLTEECATVAFDMQVQGDSLLTAHCYIFGTEPTGQRNLNHKMLLFFWLKNGRVYIPIDVTEVFAATDSDSNRLVIKSDNININLYDYLQNSSMVVDIDEWDNTSNDISF